MVGFYLLVLFAFIGASCGASNSSADNITEELEDFSRATLVASFNEMGAQYTEGFLKIFPDHRIFTQQQTIANAPDPFLKKAEELFTKNYGRPYATHLNCDVKNSIAQLLKALPEELWGSVSSYVMQRPRLINSRYFDAVLHIAQSVKLEKDSITTFLFGVEKSY